MLFNVFINDLDDGMRTHIKFDGGINLGGTADTFDKIRIQNGLDKVKK